MVSAGYGHTVLLRSDGSAVASELIHDNLTNRVAHLRPESVKDTACDFGDAYTYTYLKIHIQIYIMYIFKYTYTYITWHIHHVHIYILYVYKGWGGVSNPFVKNATMPFFLQDLPSNRSSEAQFSYI